MGSNHHPQMVGLLWALPFFHMAMYPILFPSLVKFHHIALHPQTSIGSSIPSQNRGFRGGIHPG